MVNSWNISKKFRKVRIAYSEHDIPKLFIFALFLKVFHIVLINGDIRPEVSLTL